MVILTPITINNHFNNANYVTKVDHLCSERHTFNFLLKKIDFRGLDLFELTEECLISDEIVQLREQAEELSNRKYVLCSLCSQGCITTEKLMTLQNEIDIELDEIEKKLSLMDGQGDETIDELTSLYRLIAGTSSERLMKMILKSVVSDGKTVGFELLGGLKIKEVL